MGSHILVGYLVGAFEEVTDGRRLQGILCNVMFWRVKARREPWEAFWESFTPFDLQVL